MNNPIKNFYRRHKAWFNASTRRRSKSAKAGWAKRRARITLIQTQLP